MLIQGVLFYNFSNKILVLLLLLLLYPRRDCYLQSLANAWWGLHYSYDTLVKLNSVMIALEKLKTTLQCFYLIFFLLLSWQTCSQFTLCAPSWARRPEKWSTSQIWLGTIWLDEMQNFWEFYTKLLSVCRHYIQMTTSSFFSPVY